jgi:hypothetical protein
VSESGQRLSILITTTLGKGLCKSFFGDEGAQFMDIEQMTLKKTYDKFSHDWKVIPNASAVNETMLNGRAITGSERLSSGDVLGVGRESKGIVKMRMTVELVDRPSLPKPKNETSDDGLIRPPYWLYIVAVGIGVAVAIGIRDHYNIDRFPWGVLLTFGIVFGLVCLIHEFGTSKKPAPESKPEAVSSKAFIKVICPSCARSFTVSGRYEGRDMECPKCHGKVRVQTRRDDRVF